MHRIVYGSEIWVEWNKDISLKNIECFNVLYCFRVNFIVLNLIESAQWQKTMVVYVLY